ncbi:hypothetical protein QIG60_16530, partial [Klebsiella pneumoniae]|nr:hypothetical protein [Klebsiella pneumoniae]
SSQLQGRSHEILFIQQSRSKDKNLSLINGDNERTIVDHAPFVGSIVPVVVRFFQANIEEG